MLFMSIERVAGIMNECCKYLTEHLLQCVRVLSWIIMAFPIYTGYACINNDYNSFFISPSQIILFESPKLYFSVLVTVSVFEWNHYLISNVSTKMCCRKYSYANVCLGIRCQSFKDIMPLGMPFLHFTCTMNTWKVKFTETV